MRVLALACLVLPPAAAQDEWPHWRGPRFDGAFEAEGLPTTWDAENNIRWSVSLPGPSSATPAVAGGRVYVSSLDRSNSDLLALCFDRETGDQLWRKVVAAKAGHAPNPRDPRGAGNVNTMSAPSPVADAEMAWFVYGTGDVVAFDTDGTELWRRDLTQASGKFEIEHGYSSSPLLFQDSLYLQVVHRGTSFLKALDPRTGEERWSHTRETKAKRGSKEAYTSPIPFRNPGPADDDDDDTGAEETFELLVLGADCLTAHDPSTGEETWRWAKLNPRRKSSMPAISSALAGGNGLIVVTTPQHGPMQGLRVTGKKVEELWTVKRPTPGNTTPLLYDGLLYAIDGRQGRAVCLDPTEGDVVWGEDLDLRSQVLASATGGDGKIYVMDSGGHVVVLAAGKEYEPLAHNRLDSSPTRSSIVIDGDALLIRTADELHCVGRPAEDG